MRQGQVFYKDDFAGIITETDDGEYLFEYDKEYINRFPNQPITFSMPVSGKV
jgi:serine/threonine-protein kinase HipA